MQFCQILNSFGHWVETLKFKRLIPKKNRAFAPPGLAHSYVEVNFKPFSAQYFNRYLNPLRDFILPEKFVRKLAGASEPCHFLCTCHQINS